MAASVVLETTWRHRAATLNLAKERKVGKGFKM